MDLFITSRKGKLLQNNILLKHTKLFLPQEKYIKGDLTTPASIKIFIQYLNQFWKYLSDQWV